MPKSAAIYTHPLDQNGKLNTMPSYIKCINISVLKGAFSDLQPHPPTFFSNWVILVPEIVVQNLYSLVTQVCLQDPFCFFIKSYPVVQKWFAKSLYLSSPMNIDSNHVFKHRKPIILFFKRLFLFFITSE